MKAHNKNKITDLHTVISIILGLIMAVVVAVSVRESRAASSCVVGTSTIAQCFPDAALASSLATMLAGGNVNAVFQTGMAQNVTGIPDSFISNKGIKSVEGIQNFVNVTSLNFSNNNITDLTPLSSMTKLTYLDVSHNQISDAKSLVSLNKLNHLDISYNILDAGSVITIADNIPALDWLNAAYSMNMSISIGNFAGNSNITYLDLSGNTILDLSADYLKHALPSLKTLKTDHSIIKAQSGYHYDVRFLNSYQTSTPVGLTIDMQSAQWNDNSGFDVMAPIWFDGKYMNLSSTDSYLSYNSSAGVLTVNKDKYSALTTQPQYFTVTGPDGADAGSLRANIETFIVTMNTNANKVYYLNVLSHDAITNYYDGDPIRTGYTFNGWYTAASGGTKYDLSTPVVKNMTLYAQWTINPYTVTFNSQGGNAVASETTNYNTAISTPANPIKTGYTFNGWYTAASGGTKYDFTKPVTSSFTLYAQWTINTYKVSFDLNGGSGTAPSTQTINYNSKATQPADPTRAGYTFNGWYTATSGGSKYDFNSAVTKDVALHAQWTINYTVTFNAEGGTTVASNTVPSGTVITAPTTIKTGYTFNGWYTAASGGTKYDFTKPVTATVTLYAQWTINTFIVSFDVNGGTGTPSSQTINYNALAAEPAAPSRVGYTFNGWYTDAANGSKFVFASTPIIKDTKLYAHWAINTYTVTFDTQGGPVVGSQTAVYNTMTPAPPTPIRTGYVFKYWSTDKAGASQFDFKNTPITGNITLYGQWDINVYTVTFDTQGGSNVAPVKVSYGSKAVRPVAPDKNGFKFDDWYSDKSFTIKYDFAKPVIGDVTLYARWIPSVSVMPITGVSIRSLRMTGVFILLVMLPVLGAGVVLSRSKL